jgi:hypothetical protein
MQIRTELFTNRADMNRVTTNGVPLAAIQG